MLKHALWLQRRQIGIFLGHVDFLKYHLRYICNYSFHKILFRKVLFVFFNLLYSFFSYVTSINENCPEGTTLTFPSGFDKVQDFDKVCIITLVIILTYLFILCMYNQF